MLLSHQREYPCEYENLWKFEIRYKFVENVTIGQDKHGTLGMLAKFLCIRANPYEFLTNLAILLQTTCRISCECYNYLRMPLQTLRMLANALRMKRIQRACLPILFHWTYRQHILSQVVLFCIWLKNIHV